MEAACLEKAGSFPCLCVSSSLTILDVGMLFYILDPSDSTVLGLLCCDGMMRQFFVLFSSWGKASSRHELLCGLASGWKLMLL